MGLRAAVSIALAAASFLLVSAGVSAWAPPRDEGDVGRKLAFFTERSNDFEVLFFGSSFVLRGVVPEVFDRELARRGHRVRSFNFAVGGGLGHETDALIRRVLALAPERLRVVFIELPSFPPRLWPNEFTGRAIAWHDAIETASVLRSTARLPNLSLAERVQLAWLHGLHWLAHSLPVGRAAPRTIPAEAAPSAAQDAPPSAAALEAHRGYQPYSPRAREDRRARARRKAFLADLPGYERSVAALREARDAPGSLAQLNVVALVDQAARVRAAGVEPIYFVAPIALPTPQARAVIAQGVVAPVWVFNDPNAFPTLYEVSSRFDLHHLSSPGARRFTRLLAERFAAEVAPSAFAESPAEAAGERAR